MTIDTTGLVTVVAGETGTAGAPLAVDILGAQAPEDSFAGILRKMLDAFSGDAMVVIDTNTRRVSGTSDETLAAALKSAATNADAIEACVLTPDPDQTGRSLTFSSADGEVGASTLDVVASVVATQKPKRSVESLVNSILTALETSSEAIIVVDQAEGKVLVLDNDAIEEGESTAAQIASDIAAITPGATDFVTIQVGNESESGAAEPLIFEGGSTGSGGS